MVVSFGSMPLVYMIMRAMFFAMVVIVNTFARRMLMGVLVFMFVFMGMLVGMVMVAFVVAFHSVLLFAIS